MLEKTRIPDISSKYYAAIVDSCCALKVDTIRFTGGEPTLRLSAIVDFVDYASKHIKNLHVEIITNAHFAHTYDSCQYVLSEIPCLNTIIVSYDKFHAEFVPKENLENLVEYCKRNDVSVYGHACISDPSDILKIIEYGRELGISFNYQKALPLRSGGECYKYDCFDINVLAERCEQVSSFIYMPSYGITHCCSSLFCKGSESIRRLLAQQTINDYIQSSFYKLMNKYTFGDLCKMGEIEDAMLLPVHTHRCELCFIVISTVISRGML